MATGAAITINANNVILDLNGFKLGGLGAGVDTLADGISALDRLNITIRNVTVRGFRHNIRLSGSTATSSSGHVVEDMRSENARYVGISVQGSNSTIRRNVVFGVGGSTSEFAYGIVAQQGSGMTVLQNDITGVQDLYSYGIYATSAPNVAIIENIVRNVGPLDGVGILSAGLVRQNVVANEATGSIGIIGVESVCIDNIIRNFGTALSCLDSSGNHTL